MGCIAQVRCVLVLRCGLAGVVWHQDAGFRLHKDTTPPWATWGCCATDQKKKSGLGVKLTTQIVPPLSHAALWRDG